jgi:hypothetical protein
MREYHITIKAGRGLLVALGGLAFGMIVIVAGLVYLFLAYDPLDKISLRVALGQQDLKARMAASFPVVAKIDQLLRVPLNDTISVTIPFKQHFSIPFNKTLEVPVELNTTIPVYMTVPFKSDIPIETEVFVDTVIKTTVLGVPIAVPIKGYIPVKATIPVDQQVVVKEDFQLALKAPVSVEIKDTFQIPINTVFSAEIPLKTELTIPFKEHVLANVSLEGDVAEEIPNLHIMDNTMDLKLNQMRLVWKDKP